MRALSAVFKVATWIAYLAILASLLIAAPVVLGYKPVVVLSGSMEPAYPVGSIIYYQKPASFESIEVGDAVTFGLGESLATHRVVGIDEAEQSFTTKGDANPTDDPNPVAFENVVGKALPIAIPFAGYYITYTQNWYVVAAIGAVLLIGLFLPSGRKEKEPKQKAPIYFEEALAGGSTLANQDNETPGKVHAEQAGASAPKKDKKTKKGRKQLSPQEYFKDL